MSNVRDWLVAIAAGVTILSALGGLYVSVRMRDRDREDFEALETRHDELSKLVASTREELAELKGKVR